MLLECFSRDRLLMHLLEMLKGRGNNLLIRKKDILDVKSSGGKSRKVDLGSQLGLNPDMANIFKLARSTAHVQLYKKGFFASSLVNTLIVLTGYALFFLEPLKQEIK